MTIHAATKPAAYGNQTFDHGVRLGISWHFTGDEEYRTPTAQLIVDFIRENIIEWHTEGALDEERFADMAGFLTGWIIGQYIMEEGHGTSCSPLPPRQR